MSKTRIKHSFGKYYFYYGQYAHLGKKDNGVDYNREFYFFDIIPIGKPRMTQSDKWKTDPNHIDPNKRKRKSVHNYHKTKNEFLKQARLMCFKPSNILDVIFYIPMPNSWSMKKKNRLLGSYCLEMPDIDNLVKAVLDMLYSQDKSIYRVIAEKRWSHVGSILIYK